MRKCNKRIFSAIGSCNIDTVISTNYQVGLNYLWVSIVTHFSPLAYLASSFAYFVNPTTSFVSANERILSSVGFPSAINSNDSFIALMEALNSVKGYAAIVYPIF